MCVYHLDCSQWTIYPDSCISFESICWIKCLSSPVGWGCRIIRLLLWRGVRHPNECTRHDKKQYVGDASAMLEFWAMRSTPSLLSLLAPLWTRVVAPDRILSIGQIELNCVTMLNLFVWEESVLTFKLRTYAEMNCLKWNCFCTLNGIVWNRTVFDFEPMYLRHSELFEIERFLTLKRCTNAQPSCLK